MENAASRFGQHLAHTEKKYRDRALKKLTVYLTKKKDWTPLEWDKLWKALFYCMWMSDKRPVQDELSTNLALLVHRIPHATMALQFVHSFFRTMHREWHGLDGLRLDKFYSLVRKFVRETVSLLRSQEWDEGLGQHVATILSSEIVSQLPNGLRLHLADVYLIEIYTAAKDVTTEAFIMLLEPFFTLLSSELDKTVFKRVLELVFEDLVKKYQVKPPMETSGDEEDTIGEEKARVFQYVDLAKVQHRIFAIASADDTVARNRAALYTLYKKFARVTHVDSFQTAIKEVDQLKETKIEMVKDKASASKSVIQEEGNETKPMKMSKRRKAKQELEEEVKVEKEETSQSTALNKATVEDVSTIATLATSKERKMPAAFVAKEGAIQENKQCTTQSGNQFKRCVSCGGFGKELVPNDRARCNHCERAQKAQKKVAKLLSKKRKAESLAQSVREKLEKTEVGKKVTFGKCKALRHKVSLKRLRASAKRDAVSKDTKDITSVLKRSTLIVAKS